VWLIVVVSPWLSCGIDLATPAVEINIAVATDMADPWPRFGQVIATILLIWPG